MDNLVAIIMRWLEMAARLFAYRPLIVHRRWYWMKGSLNNARLVARLVINHPTGRIARRFVYNYVAEHWQRDVVWLRIVERVGSVLIECRRNTVSSSCLKRNFLWKWNFPWCSEMWLSLWRIILWKPRTTLITFGQKQQKTSLSFIEVCV